MEHKHDYKLLTIVDHPMQNNVAHYRCGCGSVIVKPMGNGGMEEQNGSKKS